MNWFTEIDDTCSLECLHLTVRIIGEVDILILSSCFRLPPTGFSFPFDEIKNAVPIFCIHFNCVNQRVYTLSDR